MLTFIVSEKNKYEILFFSIQEQSIPIIKYLISKKYDLNYELNQKFNEKLNNVKLLKTPLMIGVQTKNLEIVKLLVENGAKSSISDIRINHNQILYTSLSPILISCIHKCWDIFEHLLNNSNLIHQKEIIFSLCYNENIEQLKKVIEKLKDVEGEPPNISILITDAFVVSCKNTEIFNYLFDNFEIINVDIKNKMIQCLSYMNKYNELDKLLIKYPSEFSDVFLNEAYKYYSEPIIACLINHGANINTNPVDTTLLTKIAERNFIGIAQMLLDRKIDINHQSNRGWTALMAAVTNGHNEMVQFLINNGADKTLKNDKNRDVLEMAKFKNREEIIEILTKN